MKADQILNAANEGDPLSQSAIEEARRAWRERKRKSRGKEVNHDWPAQRRSLVEKFCECPKGKHKASKCEGEARVQAHEWLNTTGKLCLDLIIYYIEPFNLLKPKIDEMIDIVAGVDKPGLYWKDPDPFLFDTNWEGYKNCCHRLGRPWPAIGHVRNFFTCLKEGKPVPPAFVETIETPAPVPVLAQPEQTKEQHPKPQVQPAVQPGPFQIGSTVRRFGGSVEFQIKRFLANDQVLVIWQDGDRISELTFPLNTLVPVAPEAAPRPTARVKAAPKLNLDAILDGIYGKL